MCPETSGQVSCISEAVQINLSVWKDSDPHDASVVEIEALPEGTRYLQSSETEKRELVLYLRHTQKTKKHHPPKAWASLNNRRWQV